MQIRQMKPWHSVCLVVLFLVGIASFTFRSPFGGLRAFTGHRNSDPDRPKSIFDFSVQNIDSGESVSLSKYRGNKAYLIVNMASQ
jgi:hypothetical protein